MLYSCSPECTDPRHRHALARSAHLKAPSLRAAATRVIARGRGNKARVVDLYPYDMGDEDPRGLLAQVKRLPRAARGLIAGGNAARLLKLQ